MRSKMQMRKKMSSFKVTWDFVLLQKLKQKIMDIYVLE